MTLPSYAGDSLAKRAVRFMLYMDCQTLWQVAGSRPSSGLAIVLAGPEALEVGALRYLLGWPADKTVFVDTDKRGLEVAKKKWEGVRTFHGNLCAFLKENKERVAFVHIDLQGHITEDVVAALRCLKGRLLPRAFVSLTVLRGRENEHTILWPWMKKLGKTVGKRIASRIGEDPDDLELDAARIVGYRSILGECLGESRHAPELDMLFIQPYQGHYSPMLTLGTVWLPLALRGPKWHDVLVRTRASRNPMAPIKNEWAENFIKHWALSFRRSGVPLEQVAEIFNVLEGTLTAWLAHDTRGTYDEDPLAVAIKEATEKSNIKLGEGT